MVIDSLFVWIVSWWGPPAGNSLNCKDQIPSADAFVFVLWLLKVHVILSPGLDQPQTLMLWFRCMTMWSLKIVGTSSCACAVLHQIIKAIMGKVICFNMLVLLSLQGLAGSSKQGIVRGGGPHILIYFVLVGFAGFTLLYQSWCDFSSCLTNSGLSFAWLIVSGFSSESCNVTGYMSNCSWC